MFRTRPQSAALTRMNLSEPLLTRWFSLIGLVEGHVVPFDVRDVRFFHAKLTRTRKSPHQ